MYLKPSTGGRGPYKKKSKIFNVFIGVYNTYIVSTTHLNVDVKFRSSKLTPSPR